MAQIRQRYTSQQQIEDISRAQLDERLFKLGWIPNPIKRDVGEDVIVGIYDEGRWSGLSFYVQLKGTERFDDFQLTTEDCASFQIEVAQLIHWEYASLPVVFVLWDVTRRTGIWEIISQIPSTMDRDNPSWRGQPYVNIHIPNKNRANKAGLRRLRYAVADYSYEIISRGKPFEFTVTLKVPPTPKGRKFMEQHGEFYTKGGQFTIPPEFIAEISTSEWHQRAYGDVTFSKKNPIFVSSNEGEPNPCRMDIIAPDGNSASLPYVELRKVRGGVEEGLISNDQQNIPLHFTWIALFQTYGLTMSVALVNPGLNVQDTLDALNFLRIWNTPGSKIYITPLSTLEPFMIESPLVTSQEFPDPFADLVEKLCYIQRKTGVRLALKELRIHIDDTRRIEEVHTIITTGRLNLEGIDASPDHNKEWVALALEAVRLGQGISSKNLGAESRITILDTEIPLGLGNWYIDAARIRLSETELVQMLEEMQDSDIRQVPITILKGMAEFPKWLAD